MNLRLYIICIAAVLALVVPAVADNSTATVHGEVYGWDTFEPLENAVVDVNSTPTQSMVAKYGLYSFELEPGNYSITARYYQNNTLLIQQTETITIKGWRKLRARSLASSRLFRRTYGRLRSKSVFAKKLNFSVQ